MKIPSFIFLLIINLIACTTEPQSPNVIIILADDLGYGDPQCYNPQSKIPTPNIDALAASGMQFTDAHSPSSVCTPTRYALLTGRYAWRTDLKSSVLWTWDRPLIEEDRMTMADLFKANGYATACIGKWHLGWEWAGNDGNPFANDTLPLGKYGGKSRNEFWRKIDFNKPMGGGPLAAGFEYYFGDDVPNFAPYTFFENDRLLAIPDTLKPKEMFGNPGPMVKDWDLEKVMPTITEKAVKYIHKQTQQKNPFFLYFSLTAPHTPIAPTKEFQGKSEAGLYGDFVHEVDWSVGQILEALKATEAYENTLVIFTSDNGSPQRDGSNMNGATGSVKVYGHDPSFPWRGMKGDIYEGGHRVPFVVAWPGHIPANSRANQLIGHMDLASSLANMLDFPQDLSQFEDSYDMSQVFLGKSSDQSIRPQIVHHSLNGTFAIRQGDWKLIQGKDSGGFSRGIPAEHKPVETEGQLYRLSDDPGEKDNSYATEVGKREELLELLREVQKIGNL